MLKRDRQRRIVETVGAQGQATVVDLARQLAVAEMTIRRDLDDLDAQGLLERVRGGAIPCGQRQDPELPVLERARDQILAKRRIAAAAAGMVRDGETIFLGSGTTTLAVAEVLARRSNLTVVTNALTVANVLAASSDSTVVIVGGFLRRSELSLIGHFAESALRDVRVDKVIMGIRGVDPHYGLTSEHLQELMTDRAILGISDTVIIVADHTKFGHVAASRTAPVTAASVLISDAGAPADIVAAIRALGVQVLLV